MFDGDLPQLFRGVGIDGVRIDAVPMMPRLATRRLTLALESDYAPAGASLSIGEVFTGGGRGGVDSGL